MAAYRTETGWRQIVVYRGLRIEVRSNDSSDEPPAYLQEVARQWAARVVSASHKRTDLDSLAEQVGINPSGGTKAELAAKINGSIS